MDEGAERTAAAVGEMAAMPNGHALAPGIPPLDVSGLVVTRASLITALRLWIPQLVDLAPVDGGFLLRLAGADQGQYAEQKQRIGACDGRL